MPEKVFVVVVSYNGKNNTQKCVESLLAQDVNCRVVVWDNNSTDGTKDWLLSQDDVEYFLSKENLFWTPAVNRCIEHFWDGEEYVCFMNNDIILERDTMSRLCESLKDPQVGLVAPVGSSLGGVQDYASNLELYDKSSDEIRVNYIVGAFVVLAKKTWDAVGKLDENMPLGADDHDYSIRTKHMGFKIVVRKDVYINHIGHATSGEASWDTVGSESWKYFNEKWAGYFASEEEALASHWQGVYNDKFPKGTGWSESIFLERNKDLHYDS